MSKSRWTPPKYNGTDLKHRQRLLMLLCLCISADLLIAGLLQKKLHVSITSAVIFILAFLSRYDPNQYNVRNFRIACFALMFLTVAIVLMSLYSWFWIIGLLQILGLVLFAAWPYRKRLFKRIHKP